LSRTIDNQLYDRFEAGWWDLKGEARLLHEMNPTRFGYFCKAIRQSSEISNLKVLDVGCGGGLVSEKFAEGGAQVTVFDLSGPSLEAARQHALNNGLAIDYQQVSASNLPFPDAAFDVVVCCDFVEHVSDKLDIFLVEMARVLRPGGIFLFDTINRTFISQLVAIWILQDILQIVPRRTHVWRMFVTPAELSNALRRAGIEVRNCVGLSPSRPPWEVAYNVLFHKKIGGFRISPNLKPLNYAGYGYKLAESNE
jgi:2-polyprenyl-6-hydroxyphenyl methylase/3-demethylubiquinone-9 3-methyltransferase